VSGEILRFLSELLTLIWHTGIAQLGRRIFWRGVLTSCGIYFAYLRVAASMIFLAAMPALANGANAQDIDQTPAAPSDKAALIATVFTTPLEQVWQAVITEAGIPFKRTTALQGRRRRMFIEGFVTLDCCFSPSWRNRPEEQVVQLFTDSIYVTEIHYVFKKGQSIPIPTPHSLKNLRMAIVRGFDYTFQDYFGETIAANSPADAMNLVDLGRAHVTEYSRVQFEFDMARQPRDLELGGVSNYISLLARVHTSRADLLPRLNAAIARMKKDGRIQKILQTAIPRHSASLERAHPLKEQE